MTKPFSIPEAPTNIEIREIFLEEIKPSPFDHLYLSGRQDGRMLMRDQMLPHREAAVRMFEALKAISNGEIHIDLVNKLSTDVLADVEKIYFNSDK